MSFSVYIMFIVLYCFELAWSDFDLEISTIYCYVFHGFCVIQQQLFVCFVLF